MMATRREQIDVIQGLAREEGLRQPSAEDWLKEHDEKEVEAAKHAPESEPDPPTELPV